MGTSINLKFHDADMLSNFLNCPSENKKMNAVVTIGTLVWSFQGNP